MLVEAHSMARQRFDADPSKCYQRHIREVWEELEGRRSPCTDECRKGCPHFQKAEREVRKITTDEAASLVLKYEWLAADPKTKSPLGRGIETCYGLFLRGELIGANCFGTMGGKVGDICGPAYADKTGYLMRGVCAHYAPMHAASFFTSMSMQTRERGDGLEDFLCVLRHKCSFGGWHGVSGVQLALPRRRPWKVVRKPSFKLRVARWETAGDFLPTQP